MQINNVHYHKVSEYREERQIKIIKMKENNANK